jgi:protein-tyrosine phosphatase
MRRDDPLAIGDFHSHLIPGVDDGARTLEDTLEAVERMTLSGIRKVITTPHIDASLIRSGEPFETYMAAVDAAWGVARKGVADRFPEVDFRRGLEIMLDLPDPDLTGDERLRLGGSSFVLLEWPRLQLPPGTVEVVSRLRWSGVRPIIAHPERYLGFDRELELASEWRRVGAYLQVNYGSLVGRYGPQARALAYRLLRRGWVDYLATDFHGRSHLKLYHREAVDALTELGGEEQISLLTVTNPQRVFRDEEPLPVPPLLRDRTLWGRLRELLQIERD